MANAFHVSLNVEHITDAVERYRRILGAEPVKLRADYAKFELADPPSSCRSISAASPAQSGTLAFGARTPPRSRRS